VAKYNKMKDPYGKVKENDTVRLWLKGFIESVGEAEASRLLKGVGKLELLPQHEKLNLTLADTEPGAQVYKVGDLVQTTRYGKWYWSEVREAGKYYNVVTLDDCNELIGLRADEIRKNGTVTGGDYADLRKAIENTADK